MFTMRRKSFAGAVPVPDRNLMRKMVYMPGLNAVILIDQSFMPMYVYKV
jgi:hypothetical protein